MDILGMKIGIMTVERCLGEGGMGEVYLGRDARIERHMAVTIRGDQRLTAKARDRFDREAKQSLKHFGEKIPDRSCATEKKSGHFQAPLNRCVDALNIQGLVALE